MQNKIKAFFIKGINKLGITDNKFNSIEMMIIMTMTLLFGLFLGKVFIFTDNKILTINKSSLEEIESVYNTLLNDAYKKLDKDELTKAAIDGMMELLGDKYSYYMDEEATKDFEERLKGAYSGVGISINGNDNKITVVEVFDNSPAQKAGLKSGDIFKKLNNEDVTNANVSDISSKIKGQNGKTISVVVEREGKELAFSIVTGKVEIPSVETEIFEENSKKVGYIKLSIFAENSAKQFKNELNKLNEQKIDSLIIDLRGNSGGYLLTVTDILKLFLNQKQVMYQIEVKGKVSKYYGSKEAYVKLPIVILIDSGSASASEVMAAALSEEYGATLVGTKTYGKGSVQKTMTLDNGTMIKYTTETWLTSKGNSINEKGVNPDVEVIFDFNNYEPSDYKTDNQLQSALEEITK